MQTRPAKTDGLEGLITVVSNRLTTARGVAARAVDLVYNAGGGSVVYATSPLQRHFRDIHVATQHIMVAPATLELAGRILLGLEADTSML